MKRLFLRGAAAALSVVVFMTNVVFAHAAEINFWDQRREAIHQNFNPAFLPPASALVSSGLPATLPKGSESSLLPIVKALPQNFGSIRKITVPSAHSNRVVIHIQDIHRNQEAQENIGNAVRSLIDNKTVDLVALEGAFAPIDLSWYRSYPHQAAIKAVADWLLKENRISGPVYAALRLRSGQALPEYVGIDEKKHYDANVEAYRRAAALAGAYKKKIEEHSRALNAEKSKKFNSALKDFDTHIDAYRNGSRSWGDYVIFLAKRRGKGVFSSKMEAFLSALELERSLDFKRIEADRTQLITRLMEKLSKPETDDLVSHSVAYQLGNINHSDFYGYLKDLCARKNINLARTPAMAEYIRYVLLSESLDVDAIMKEAADLEMRIAASLAKTPTEKRLLVESHQLYLIAKLLDFALTKKEWEEYKENLLSPSPCSIDLSSFENFYREAEARDQAMSENLEKAMDASHAKVAVLVTGGFHADGLFQRLQSKGVTVISYVPKIGKVENENGSAYLSAFAQEKTPLDKLFAGEKLFLASAPAPNLAGGKLFAKSVDAAETSPSHKSKTRLITGAILVIVVAAGGAIVLVSIEKGWFDLKTVLVAIFGAGAVVVASLFLIARRAARQDAPASYFYLQWLKNHPGELPSRKVKVLQGLGGAFLEWMGLTAASALLSALMLSSLWLMKTPVVSHQLLWISSVAVMMVVFSLALLYAYAHVKLAQSINAQKPERAPPVSTGLWHFFVAFLPGVFVSPCFILGCFVSPYFFWLLLIPLIWHVRIIDGHRLFRGPVESFPSNHLIAVAGQPLFTNVEQLNRIRGMFPNNLPIETNIYSWVINDIPPNLSTYLQRVVREWIAIIGQPKDVASQHVIADPSTYHIVVSVLQNLEANEKESQGILDSPTNHPPLSQREIGLAYDEVEKIINNETHLQLIPKEVRYGDDGGLIFVFDSPDMYALRNKIQKRLGKKITSYKPLVHITLLRARSQVVPDEAMAARINEFQKKYADVTGALAGEGIENPISVDRVFFSHETRWMYTVTPYRSEILFGKWEALENWIGEEGGPRASVSSVVAKPSLFSVLDREFLRMIWWTYHPSVLFQDHPGEWWQQAFRVTVGLPLIHGTTLALLVLLHIVLATAPAPQFFLVWADRSAVVLCVVARHAHFCSPSRRTARGALETAARAHVCSASDRTCDF